MNQWRDLWVVVSDEDVISTHKSILVYLRMN